MLTQTQIEAREGKLTASRIACLMTGDRQAILDLYLEMIGEKLPENLDDVWPVQLGAETENLNLRWYEKKNVPHKIIRRGEVCQHKTLPWAAATLDGWIDQLGCPIECKHVGGREPIEVIIDRYMPQMQWQMACSNAELCAISIIAGAAEPIVEFVERAPAYIAEMVARGEQFMRFVAAREPPVELDLEPVEAPKDWQKIYSMNGNNQWAYSAGLWLESKDAAAQCRDAEKILKNLVPADAKKAHGHGVQITRDRAGRLSLREEAT